MAHIITSHSVGNTAYVYDADSDSVRRVVITEVVARSRDESKYGGGEWSIAYMARALAEPDQAAAAYTEDELHDRAERAFPLISALAPVAETEAARTAYRQRKKSSAPSPAATTKRRALPAPRPQNSPGCRATG
jgi:hypothetical protein